MLIVLLSPLVGAALAGLLYLLLRWILWQNITSEKDLIAAFIKKICEDAGRKLEPKLLGENGILYKELESFVGRDETMQALSPVVALEVEKFVDVKLEQRWPMISMFLNAEAKEKMKTGLTEELLKTIPDALNNMGNGLLKKMEAEHFIKGKMDAISVLECKNIIRPYIQSVFKKLFWGMIIMGSFIAFITGGLVWLFC